MRALNFSFQVSSLILLLCFMFSAGVRSQPLTFNTLAGNPPQGSADGTGNAARFNNPWGVAADTSGNIYVADTDNHTIRKVTPGGMVTTLAGLAGVSGTNNGVGSAARFFQPQGVVVDSSGNIYVADTGNDTIRLVTSAGVVTTIAGSPGVSGTNNGVGSLARFYEPEGIAINNSGATLYVSDTWNHTIRQVTIAGVVTTFAGSAGTPGTNNATGLSAQFNQPEGIAVDGAGNVYVGDTGNQLIRFISPGGVVSTFAGSVGNSGTNNGTGTSAQFWDPQGIALDSATNIYVADSFNNTIRKITPAGVVTTLVGSAGTVGSADATGSAARFWQPQGVAVDSAGNIYVADTANGTVRKITSASVVTTLAGLPSIGSSDGSGSTALFNGPVGAAIDNSGVNYLADTQNGTIRKITSGGAATTLAGLAGSFGAVDGTGTNARFYGPQGLATDSSGNLYVADTANHTIRKITSGGVVSTLAGLAGTNGVSDGTGATAQFNFPQGLAADGSGNVYVADTWNHTIRKVTSGGVVTTIAGIAGTYGDSDGTGDNVGTNNTAQFYCPSAVAMDGAGNIFVADTRNHTIRRITSGGLVSTLAGLPGSPGSADGTNNSARFYLPIGISVDASGNLYVVDSGNHTVRMVALVGTNWVVSTIGGVANLIGSADGTGSTARFSSPAGLGMNNSGIFCVADWGNNTIRAANSSLSNAPTILVQPQPQTVSQGSNATFNVTAAGSAPLSYQWLFNGTNIGAATGSAYTVSNAQPANAGFYSVMVSNSLGTNASSNALLTVIVPPTITNQPQSLTVNQGSNATFTVAATGTAPFSYQWLFNSNNISGATGSSYTRTNAQPGDAGNYSVIVSNSAGAATSSNAVLTVNQLPTPPSITTPPQSLTVGQGSNAIFSVTASGSTPFSYQWLFNGTVLAGGTSSNYTVLNSQPSNAGPYSVIVTNLYGAVTSSAAQLTVILPPIISVQPVSQFTAVSNSVTFSVGISQGDSPTYQWRQNGTPISGATQSSFTMPSVLWTNAGSYSVTVSNLAGNSTSSNAVLTLEQAAFTFFDGFESYNLGLLDNNFSGPNANPTTNPWWALTGPAQGTVTNSSTGVSPHGGAKMAGRTGSSFLQDYINLTYRFDAGQAYYGNILCEWWFYDPYGTTSLVSASNYVDYIALGSYSPVSTTNDNFASSFTIFSRMSLGAFNTTGFNVSNYQARIMGTAGQFGSQNSWYNTATPRSPGWHHARIVFGIPNSNNFAPVSMYIDNMTNATLSTPTSGTNTGFNIIEMNHANGNSGYYDDLTFRAANDPWIIEQPVSITANPGQSAYFNTVAVGTFYQWQFNGNNIAGATTSSYTIPSAGATNAGNYACAITGTNGTITTSNAILSVNGPPIITTQPSSLTVTQTQSATFSVTAAGTGPLGYQWQFNSNDIPGANGTNYTIASAFDTNAGSYDVIVTNSLGSVTSSVVTLTVNVPPSITAQPLDQTLQTGNCAIFSVTATGTAPLYYQWLSNGVPQGPFDTSSNSPSECVAGSYSVLVSNLVGTVLSSAAILSFTNPPAAQPGNFDSITLLTNSWVLLNMSGTPYTNYVLDFTTNFTDWSSLGTLSGTNGTFQFSDPSPVTNSERFYRLRLGP